MSSQDGLHFHHLPEAFIRPGPEPENWHERALEVGPGLVPTGGGEMSLYLIEHYRLPTVRIRRAVLREDGFVSLHAGSGEGELVTRPLVLRGRRLELNYATSAAGSVRVEVQNVEGQPLPGYRLMDCQEIFGDEGARVVCWKGESDLGRLEGKVIRLRFVLSDADLFAFRFCDPEPKPQPTRRSKT
jgi:hypothetical protein